MDNNIIELQTIHVNVLTSLFKLIKEGFGDINIVCIGKDEPVTYQDTDTYNKISFNDFSKRGIYVQAISESHSMTIDCYLNADDFNIFKCSNQYHVFGVNAGSFYKTLDSIKSPEALTIYITEQDKSKVHMTFENEVNGVCHNISFFTLDLNMVTFKVDPVSTYNFKFTFSTSEFHRLCKEIFNIGGIDDISITVTSTDITFQTNGIREQTSIYKPSDNNKITIEKCGPLDTVTNNFDLKELYTCTKNNTLSPTITLYTNNNMPLIVVYDMLCMGQVSLFFHPKN